MLESLNSSQFDELNDYHYGNLPIDEKLLFEAKMISDPSLAESYVEFKQTLQIIKSQHNHDIKNSFSLIDSELDKDLFDDKNPFQRYKYTILSVSIFCLVVMVFYFKFDKVNPAVSFNERDLGLPTVMGIGNQPGLDKAMSFYKQNQYEQSEKILKALLKSNSNDTLNYYIGINEYELQHFQAAIEFLNKVGEKSVFFQKSLYRRGLSYWQLDEVKEAKRVFNFLQNENSPYLDQSRAILKKIK